MHKSIRHCNEKVASKSVRRIWRFLKCSFSVSCHAGNGFVPVLCFWRISNTDTDKTHPLLISHYRAKFSIKVKSVFPACTTNVNPVTMDRSLSYLSNETSTLSLLMLILVCYFNSTILRCIAYRHFIDKFTHRCSEKKRCGWMLFG